jgi:alpha-D-ribose 1-methylphosphonate 5-triphosphate diphosphatase
MENAVTPGELILKNAMIVTPTEVVEGTVQICGGVVAGIHRGPSSVPAALDFEGDYLIPASSISIRIISSAS